MKGGVNMKEEFIAAALSVGKKALDYVGTEDGKKMLFGTYTDGEPRSFVDAWNDEIISPKTREWRIKQIEERRKLMEKELRKQTKKANKKKKKHKKKKKKSSSEIFYW